MIGTRLCEQLIESKLDFIGVDWNRNQWNEEIEQKTIHFDLRKASHFDMLPKDIDIVIHLAANARVYNLVIEPLLARDNFETFFNVLEFSRKNNVHNLLFSSSREVYGSSVKTILHESDSNFDNCQSPYAATKIANEALINAYHQCYGIDFTIFRFSNVYGMYDYSDRLIPEFIKRAQKDDNLIIYGKDKVIDITYIDDTIQGIFLAIQNYESSRNSIFNIAYGSGVPIAKVAEMIIEKLNSKSKIIVKENREGEIMKYVADISNSRNLLGYNPKVAVEDGIERSLRWYKDNRKE